MRSILALPPASDAYQRIRKGKTWLIIPTLDPDLIGNQIALEQNSIAAQFFGMADSNPRAAAINDSGKKEQDILAYLGNKTPCEVRAYATYLRTLVNGGHVLEMAIAVSNNNCAEFPVLMSPAALEGESGYVEAFNTLWFRELSAKGIPVGSNQPFNKTAFDGRLAAWCNAGYKALDLRLAFNDRFPAKRINIKDYSDLMGSSFLRTYCQYMESDAGQDRTRISREFLQRRENNINVVREAVHWLPKDEPTFYQILVLGM